jgi:hypothetical protein
MRRYDVCGVFASLLLLVASCKSTYYGAYEKVGVYKRDLLKKRVVAARDAQKDAQQEFKDALTRLREIANFEGGEIEKRYHQLQSDYDGAAGRVGAVHKRVQAVQTVANDLFAEWEKENQEIGTESLRATSRQQLTETRQRYDQMLSMLKRAEASMDPVLHKLHDYVLALKHSLNAQAIATLKGEAVNIQVEINRLLEDMNASTVRADEFIKGLPQ